MVSRLATTVAIVLSGLTGIASSGTSLPDLALIDSSGRTPVVDYAGQVVLIDAWATWCAPCLAELPRLRRLAEEHADELVIVGLSVDRMPRRDFVAWLQRQDVTWPQHFDGRGYDSPAARRMAINAVPDTWLFDGEGRLVVRGLRGPTLETAIDLLVTREAAR